LYISVLVEYPALLLNVTVGAVYSEYLKPGVNVLICNSESFSKEKLEFAVENGIDAVNENWLYQSVDTAVKQDPKDFAMKTETPTVPIDYAPPKPKTGVPKASIKGR
jgi:hypothetical protein